MKATFITTPSRTHLPNYIVPTGVLSIAAYLEQNNFTASIVDAAALREPIDKIVERTQNEDPSIVGISGIITAYAYTVELINKLKERMPNIPVVLGGQLTINTSDLFFKHTKLDFIVHGYGEIAMLKLMRHLKGELTLDQLPGISYRFGDNFITNPGREFFQKLDDMPMPAYHLIDMEHYATVRGEQPRLKEYLKKTGKTIKNHRMINVMGTLGCTDMCTFCVHEQEFVGLKVYSNEYLVDHMERLHKKYDINVFGIGEEMFLTTPARLRKFAELMNERLPNVFWTSSTRGNYITEELVTELENTNCYSVGWGLESGSDKILTLMKKRMTSAKNMNAYQNLAKTAIRPSASLMIGNIGEDYYTARDTMKFVKEINMPLTFPFFATPYPGARIWDWAIERGLIRDRHQFLLDISNKDIANLIHSNMTPFPFWFLRGLQRMIAYATYLQKDSLIGKVLKIRTLGDLRLLLSVLKGPLLIPAPFLPPILWTYQKCHDLRKKLFKTQKDDIYHYELDKDQSMRPDKIIAIKPQRALKPEELEETYEKIKANRNKATQCAQVN